MTRIHAAAYLARALDPDVLADLDRARTAIRVRVAEWLLTLPPAEGPDGARLAALHHILPAWIAGGCVGRVPDGVALEWAARAGVRHQSAAQMLAGVRRLSGRLRDVLPATRERHQADAVAQHRAEVDALIAEFRRDAGDVPDALVAAVVEAMR